MKRNLFLFASCLTLLGVSSVAQAFRPEILSSKPRGMQRGTTQKVIINGNRLKDGHQLLFDRAGIEVHSIKPLDDRRVEVELEVPAATQPGLYPMRLVARSGLSNVLMFGVGTMPMVDEKEPNSEFATPQPIPYNVTVEGSVAREDEDYFVVDLKQGDRLTAELEGVRIKKGRASPFFDPYVAILNQERYELATSDDAPLLQQDCLCSIEAPKDGKYIIMVRDSSFGGNNDRYRLHVGSYPRAIAVVPAGGPPGAVVDMTFISMNGETWTESVSLPLEASEAFPLVASNEHGVSPSPNHVRVQPMPNVLEQEPNNSFKQSTPAQLPGAFCGVVAEPGDIDYFNFDAKKGQTLQVKLFARKVLRSELDGVIGLYDEQGKRLGGNDDTGGPDSYLEYKIPRDGKYHLNLRDHLRGGGSGHAYRIEAKLAAPELTLTLPDRQRYVATQINVPQGNRAAVMINAARRRISGAVDVSGLNLPAGVTIVPIPMPANRDTVPLLLRADADAKLDGRLVNLSGRISGTPTVGRFYQRHQLLIGRNNSVVYDYQADRAAVAVTQALPCTIQMVPPQVPVVREGAMDLVIEVDRGGFEGDIPVRMLYHPPGIGSSGSIKIPKGKDRASIPITANKNAAIGTWPLIAYATVAGLEIATEPVNVEVADKIFTFTFPKTACELGGTAEVLVGMDVGREFTGTCQLELVGLPAGVLCEQPQVKVDHNTKQVAFPVKIDSKARVSQHKTLFVRATITSPLGVIQQTQGTGVLQIDKPLPAAVTKSAKKQPVAPPVVAKQAATASKPKPLSRLEQLRLQSKQKN